VATGQRGRLSEVGVFTVRGGRIVQEEYLYLRG
ncbi:MAG: nuclear transport factor 2 family protein, partial [Nitrospirae bacterium]